MELGPTDGRDEPGTEPDDGEYCPTQEEILLARAAIHFADGDLEKASLLLEEAKESRGWREFDAVCDDADDEPPQCRSLAQCGLPDAIVLPLESRGVTLIGDLCGWTEQRLLKLPGFGRKKLDTVRAVMAANQCALRVPGPGEPEQELPPRIDRPKVARQNGNLSLAERKQVIDMLAAGRSQREIARDLKLKCRYSVWNEMRRWKARMAALIADVGERAAARQVGHARWQLWATRRVRSKPRDA